MALVRGGNAEDRCRQLQGEGKLSDVAAMRRKTSSAVTSRKKGPSEWYTTPHWDPPLDSTNIPPSPSAP